MRPCVIYSSLLNELTNNLSMKIKENTKKFKISDTIRWLNSP